MENNEQLNEELAPGADSNDAATSENVESTTDATQDLNEDANDSGAEDEEIEGDEEIDGVENVEKGMEVSDDDSEAQHDAVKSEN